MTDQTTAPADVVSSNQLGTGWAYAGHNCAEDWCGGFKTREQAVAELLDVYPDGGWVAQTREVTEDDEDVQDGWTLLCIVETYEHVKPNPTQETRL